MKTFSTIIFVMSFFCIYTSIYQTVIYFRGLKNKTYLYFAFLSLCIGLYDILCAELYLAKNIQSGINIQIWQSILLTLSGIGLLLFVFSFLKKKRNIIGNIIILYLLFFTILLIIFKFINPNLLWDINKPSVKEFQILNQISIKYFEASPGILTIINSCLSYFAIFYLIFIIFKNYNKKKQKNLFIIIVCLLIYITCLINDILVSLGHLKFIYLIEFSFFFMVLAMNHSLTTLIINQTKLEKAYNDQQIKYKKLFDAVSEAILIINKKTNLIIDANFSACKLFGYSYNELTKIDYNLLFKKNDDHIYNSLSNNKDYQICIKKDDVFFPAENFYGDIKLQNEEMQIIAIRDKTENYLAQKEIQEEKEILSVTLANIQDGVITTDWEGNIILMNKNAEKLTEFTIEESIGKNINSIFNIINEKTKQCAMDFINEITDGFYDITSESILISKTNKHIIIKKRGAVIKDKINNTTGVVITFHDITSQEIIEKELSKRQKLESLGILAGGIAHDFNNFLVGILGNINLLRFGTNENDKSYNLLLQAEKAALRAKDLTHQLLTFSRGGQPIKKIISIKSIIKDSALFALCGSNVKCNINIPDDLWNLNVDPNQMGQVINNLIINANQAMPNGGTIMLEAFNKKISENIKSISSKDYFVVITIADQGCGIKEKNIDKIFDPFFTTNENGSGLGLTIVYSIIKNHGGNIEVKSKENEGTIFTIYLPAVPDTIKLDRVIVEKKIIKGKGNILIIDDDKTVSNVLCNMLEHLGYTYNVVNNSLDAVVYYKSAFNENKPYDLAIIDLTLPDDLSGEEILKELKEIKNDIKAIVTSGYSNSPILSNYQHYGFSGILQKPYNLSDLSNTLYEIISKK